MTVSLLVKTLEANCKALKGLSWPISNATINVTDYGDQGYLEFTVSHKQHCAGKQHSGHVRTITPTEIKGQNDFSPAHVSLEKNGKSFDEKTNYFFEISAANAIEPHTPKKKSKDVPGTSLSINHLPDKIAPVIMDLLQKMYANTV